MRDTHQLDESVRRRNVLRIRRSIQSVSEHKRAPWWNLWLRATAHECLYMMAPSEEFGDQPPSHVARSAGDEYASGRNFAHRLLRASANTASARIDLRIGVICISFELFHLPARRRCDL